MNNTDTKTVKIIPKQPRFISDILKRPARIDEEITMALNEKEIVRCMQYADVYAGDKLLTPFDISSRTLVKDEEVVGNPDKIETEDQTEPEQAGAVAEEVRDGNDVQTQNGEDASI